MTACWDAAATAYRAHLKGTGLAAGTIDGYVKHVEWLAETAPAEPWVLGTH
ncbi:MAG: hypothetical protein JWM79_3428, partial [Nocardioides sp.]|nr:hypothetical protein [Nocardioides sp.]